MDVVIREVQCANCGRSTWHPASTLEQIVQLQSVLLQDVRYINYACPECNKLTRSPLRPARFVPEAAVLQILRGLASYVVSLECARQGCESPVMLLASAKDEASLQAARENDWYTLSAVCLNNAAPIYPYEFRGSMRP